MEGLKEAKTEGGVTMEGLKEGALIKCKDCRKALKDLSDLGYGAVRASYDGHWIRITRACSIIKEVSYGLSDTSKEMQRGV